MKIIFTLALLVHFAVSYSQWTKVQQLPSTDIASLYHKDGILYAGGKNIIYFSKDKGQTWDSTRIAVRSTIPIPVPGDRRPKSRISEVWRGVAVRLEAL